MIEPEEEPTELDLVYQDLRKAQKRIAQLEAELKQALDQNKAIMRISGQKIEEQKAITEWENSEYRKFAETVLAKKEERIAQLEEWNKKLVSRLEDANKALTVVEQSRNDWHDKSDRQDVRIAQLEAECERLKAIGHRKNEEAFKKGIRIVELEELAIRLLEGVKDNMPGCPLVEEARALLEKGKKCEGIDR